MKADCAHEVIVIGAGPAGTAAAAILANYGHRVLVLEKETFPRYAVGESLIPFCYFPLERLGMVDRLNRAGFQKKFSVQFVREDGRVSQPFYFEDHFSHPAAQTWQVSRDRFDHMLAENARERGAEIREGMKAVQPLMADNRVTGIRAMNLSGKPTDFTADLVIDASGRSMFSMLRNGWRIPDGMLQKIAVWTYFEDAERDPGRDEGATTVAYLRDKNWFWYIPLAGNRVSVGVVGDPDYLYRDTRDPEVIFQREVGRNAWISSHLRNAVRAAPFQVTSDFSYRSRYCAQDGLVLAGDAMGFLDPVFSSGVLLALRSGTLAADAAHDALVSGDVSAGHFAAYGQTMRRSFEAMRMLVYAFYDPGFSFKTLFSAHPHLRHDLTDCLIGNVDRDFTRLADALSELSCWKPDMRETLGVPLYNEHTPDHARHR